MHQEHKQSTSRCDMRTALAQTSVQSSLTSEGNLVKAQWQLQAGLFTSASRLARVSARAVTASCEAKPLLLSSGACFFPSGVMLMAGTKSRNRDCAPLADLTGFCSS